VGSDENFTRMKRATGRKARECGAAAEAAAHGTVGIRGGIPGGAKRAGVRK